MRKEDDAQTAVCPTRVLTHSEGDPVQSWKWAGLELALTQFRTENGSLAPPRYELPKKRFMGITYLRWRRHLAQQRVFIESFHALPKCFHRWLIIPSRLPIANNTTLVLGTRYNKWWLYVLYKRSANYERNNNLSVRSTWKKWRLIRHKKGLHFSYRCTMAFDWLICLYNRARDFAKINLLCREQVKFFSSCI